jgi:hypothetical protein
VDSLCAWSGYTKFSAFHVVFLSVYKVVFLELFHAKALLLAIDFQVPSYSALPCLSPALKKVMRRIALYAIVLTLLLPSCSNRAGGSTTMVVKPKNHHWWFNKKKDKGKKRTKMVRMRN